MQKLYFAIQLLQLLCLGYGGLIHKRYPEGSFAYLGPDDDGGSMRLKRQTETTSRNYTIGPFSECSDTCGGGLRTRSVRCLNEDGVISNDCDLNDRPASYEFCNQIDCVTGNLDSSLLPVSDTYSFTVGDYSSELQFNNQGTGSYMVLLETTESDGTGTTLLQTVTPQGSMTQLSRTAAMNMMAIVNSGGNSIFEVDGENILTLNNVEQTDVAGDDSISFQNNMIIPGSGDVSVDTLVFFDGLRYYMFSDTDLVNPLNGPGTLYYNPDTLQVFYSTSTTLNQNLDAAIASLMNVPTEVMTEVTTTSTPSSSTPDQTTTSVTIVTQPTTLPPGTPSTTLPPGTPFTTLPPGTPSTTLPPGTPPTTLPPATTNLATSFPPTSMTATTEDLIDVCDDDSTSSSFSSTSKSSRDEDSSRKKTKKSKKSRKSKKSTPRRPGNGNGGTQDREDTRQDNQVGRRGSRGGRRGSRGGRRGSRDGRQGCRQSGHQGSRGGGRRGGHGGSRRGGHGGGHGGGRRGGGRG